MSVPHNLIQAAFATLSEETIRRAAEHNNIPSRDAMSAQELAEELGRDGRHLRSYSSRVPLIELQRIAELFGLEVSRPKRSSLALAVSSFVEDYERDRERERARELAPGLPKLSFEELIAEASKVQRPVIHLKPRGTGPPMGIWTAEADPSREGTGPWISVDLRQHPDERVRRDGILDVHVDDCELTGYAEFRSGRLRAPIEGEVSLHAAEAWEKPSVERLFRKGSRKVQNWLGQMKEHGWDLRPDWDNPRFPLLDLLYAYADAWRAEHPLYTSAAYAQLGGWSLTWPEEGAEERLSRNLVLRTYRASEPWVEVFQRGNGYDVRIRIT